MHQTESEVPLSSQPFEIRKLPALDFADLAPLMAEASAEGFGMVARLVRHCEDGTNRFDRPGEAIFGAFADGRMVGVCGLNIDPMTGDPRYGRVRHLYVSPAWRRQGIGRALVRRVIAEARQRFEYLALRTNNETAAAFYLALGFSPTSELPQTTHVMRLAREVSASTVWIPANGMRE